MSTIAQKINTFITSLKASAYEIDADFEALIRLSLANAKLDQPMIVQQDATPVGDHSGAQKTKQLNCYNVFMQEKMVELKAQGVPGTDLVKGVSSAWAALSQAEKDTYKAKALLTTPVNVHAKANPQKKGPKGLTGWQLYVKLQMPAIKLDASIVPTARLGEISKKWKLETQAEKDSYKVKASTWVDAAAA